MNPSDRLKEIAKRNKSMNLAKDFHDQDDIHWLIARVKRLTEALEEISKILTCVCGETARRALQETDDE